MFIQVFPAQIYMAVCMRCGALSLQVLIVNRHIIHCIAQWMLPGNSPSLQNIRGGVCV